MINTKTILFFDTETTGLKPEDRIIQLGYIIGEYNGENMEIIERKGLMINPGIPIPEEATKIHGITDDDVMFEPTFKMIAGEFMKNMIKADLICGHNVDFDFKMLFNEVDRIWDDESKRNAWKKQINNKGICTMQSSIQLCKLPFPSGRAGYKWPKLIELHKFLFGEEFDGAHDALVDIEATMRCFVELHKRKKISIT